MYQHTQKSYLHLQVNISDGQLTIAFKLPFTDKLSWKKAIALSDITGAKITRTKWYYGWGMRYTPSGWLYNVYGLDAVAVTLKNGKCITIGSDDADNLVNAIQNAISSQ